MNLIKSMLTRIIACSIVLTGLFSTIGCASLDRPSGGGFPSSVAENVLRISMVDAFDGIDFSHVKDETFDIKLSGFADDELKSYLEYISRIMATKAGGRYEPGDADIQIELNVHACGTNLTKSPAEIQIIWYRAKLVGTTFLDLAFIKDGKSLHRQTLKGAASNSQSVIFSIIKIGTGRYKVQDKPRWHKVNHEDYRIPKPVDESRKYM